MPRKGRGGARTGSPGTAYSNRTDLNTTQPVAVAPSQQYGQATLQQHAQETVPLPNNAGQLAAMTQAAATPSPVTPPGPLPGAHGAFDRATELPNQPATTGIPGGAGAGPEALTGGAREANMTSQLANLAQLTGNPDIQALAARAQAQRTQ